ncbi:MAG: hypothetical protein AAFZ15_00540 [Bacteroidota bacterium]
MNKKLQYLFFAILAILLITNKDQICQHLGFGQAKLHDGEVLDDNLSEDSANDSDSEYVLMNDSVFVWDEMYFEFVPVRLFDPEKDGGSPFTALVSQSDDSKPIKVTWQTLTRIEYVLKYYEEVGMEMYAPVFHDNLKKLDGKLVEVEGFVIPFEETGAEIALSANPFASCFFCGKASPASVMSIKLAKKGKNYKMDEYLKFTGRLRLNYGDPMEFYYVLEGAKER